jgi:hypothetical protein
MRLIKRAKIEEKARKGGSSGSDANLMNLEVAKYIREAGIVIRNNLFPLFIPIIIRALFLIPQKVVGPPSVSLFISMILLLIIYPLVYGQYIEIILHGREISYFEIFKTHWLNFFSVSLLIGLPALILSAFATVIIKDSSAIEYTLWLLMSGLTLYIFPLVFLLRKRLESITLGLKCLFGNFSFSLPLLLLSFVPLILALLAGQQSLDQSGGPFKLVFDFVFQK